jgi:hypothetical protein
VRIRCGSARQSPDFFARGPVRAYAKKRPKFLCLDENPERTPSVKRPDPPLQNDGPGLDTHWPQRVMPKRFHNRKSACRPAFPAPRSGRRHRRRRRCRPRRSRRDRRNARILAEHCLRVATGLTCAGCRIESGRCEGNRRRSLVGLSERQIIPNRAAQLRAALSTVTTRVERTNSPMITSAWRLMGECE